MNKLLGTLCTAALLIAGCASQTTQTGLATSGQSLVGIGTTFIYVGAVYQQQCVPTPRLAKLTGFCNGFRTFGARFKQAYPAAIDAWEAARKANDASKANDAASVILQLSTDLTALTLQALTNLQ